MLITTALAEVCFGSSAKIRILTILRQWSGSEMTERQLARLCRLSPFGLRHALADLERWNVVTKKAVGRSNVWSLNRQCFLFAALLPLLKRMADLPTPYHHLKERLLKALPLRTVEKIVLFGSAAGVRFEEAGDIDLAVWVKRAGKKGEVTRILDRLSGDFLPSLGKRLEGHVFSKNEWVRVSQTPLGRAIEKGKEIFPHEQV